ncbi:Prolipoprotein diacylglyceryl transferase [Mycobacterium marinum]|uniref:prolipoprotein diacylglyceryl transferase n=1 Tax=Mycobacterium marinum TaxID=1781 RepID=UPI000E28B928|nr:prolipoprotein diacylglyceryl transferase [Mycobacterium marinum]AXN44353.1 Prolipoprotein diacylglyceryl transferase [Mycobacterium marinum]RFZ09903.1 Prolipoprotein diacylglyceryl transferase [Mycobacterium marinum]
MTATVLAYFPSPPRGVWHLGPLPIRAYAFFIIIGIVMGLMIGDRRFAARGGERGVIYDIALWMVPFGLIGGRLYHLSTDWQTYFGEGGAGLGAALRIWDGGLGIWGAVTLGTVGAWIGCRRRGIPLPAFLDAVAPGVVMGQAIGRLGNYFNQELYGRETTVPWGLEIFYRRDPSGFVDVHSLDGVSTGQVAVVVQPTFLYELIWNLLVFAALIYLDRRFTIGHGRLFASYVALYCVGRFCVELLRDDTATHIAGIRINSFTSTFVFIGAVVYIILAPKGREDPASVRGTTAAADEVPEPEPAGEVATADSTAAALAGDREGDEPTGLAETAEAAEVAEPETVGSAVAGDESTADTEASDAVEGEVGEAAEAEAPEAEVPEVGEVEAAEEVAEAVDGEVEAAEAGEVEVAEAVEGEVEAAEAGEVEVAEAVEGEVEAAAEAEMPELGEVEAAEEADEAGEGEVEAVEEAAEAEAPEVGEVEVAEAVDGEVEEAAEPEEAEVEEAAEPEEAEAGEDEPKEAAEVAEAEGSEAEDKTAQAIDGGQTGVDDADEADAEPDDDSTAAEPEVVVEQADIEEIEPQEPEAEALAAAEATDADEGDGEPAEPASDDLDAVAAEDADATATEAEESGDESPEPAADSEEPGADESAPEDSAEDTSSGESDTQSELEQSQTIEQGSDQTSAGDGEGPPPSAAVDGDTGPTRQGWRGRLRNRMRRSGR